MADKTPTPTSIKIAAKDASKRVSAGGTADPGPGDPSAAPSEAPQLVDIPEAPRPSELVVNSATGQPERVSMHHADKSVSQPGALVSASPSGMQPGASGVQTGVSGAQTGASAAQPAPSSAKSTPNTISGMGNIPEADASPPSPSPDNVSPITSPTTSSPASSTPGSSRSPSQPHSKSPAHGGHAKRRFRFHKRVVVSTKNNKTSQNQLKEIMKKVNYKDQKAGITPSAIEEMDPQELMRKAGIKETKKGTHWRVRLRQTETITKNGKTSTRTKVAYRDSAGHKKIITSGAPVCEKCSKSLEECECKPSEG